MAATGPGVVGPRAGTPDRRPGSVRRTTTHTSLRPDGILGDVHLQASGRDMWTQADGSAQVLDEGRLDTVIAYLSGRILTSLRVEPPSAGDFDALVGIRVSGGFRKELDRVWGDSDRGTSLMYQLLDELPTAALVSGYSLGSAGIHPPPGSFDMGVNADICAGWATGGTLLTEGARLGRTPSMQGPPAAPLPSPVDPAAWHDPGPTGPHAMRRWRQIDVWRPDAAGAVEVEAFFRDSHFDAEGSETVVHEYVVTATLEPATHLFLSCGAVAGALPWTECPGALASAGRLVGTSPADLRARVRETFVGTSTCTHLNDTLRALAVLPALAGMVEAGAPIGTHI